MSLDQSLTAADGLPWADLQLNPQWLAAVRAHPRFADAFRASGELVAGTWGGARILNLVANDRGRFVASLLALSLHFEAKPGLSATRLRAACVEQGLCSEGRAAALIAAMTWAGFLAPAPPRPGGDRRQRLLVPTEKFLAANAARWRAQLAITARIFPEAGALVPALDDPAVVGWYALVQGRTYLSGLRMNAYVEPLNFFTERNAGLLVLLTLLNGADEGGWTPVSALGLAKRFHVSRTHMLTLLRDAVAAGHLEREGEARYRVGAPMREAVEEFIAGVYIVSALTARGVVAELDRGLAAA